MRPKTIDELVGQEQVKEVVRTLIFTAKKTGKAVKHFLCNSPPGFGKTSLAYIIANEINSNVFTVNCAGVNKFKQLISIMENMANTDVLFLEECHSLPQKVQESLYTVMEDFCYYDENGQKIDIANITIIGATTNIGALSKPMRDRFNFIASFSDYSEQELIDICNMVCREKGFSLKGSIASIITKTCRGTPRLMVNRTEWIYDYMSANNLKSINKDKLLKIIALQGINEDGLEVTDIEYLKLLTFKPISLSALSAKLSVDQEQIKSVIEPYLFKLGLIEVVSKGRKLTAKGSNYVKHL